MPVQERGIEWYWTPGGQKRYRVRWRENGQHKSKSFRKLTSARKFLKDAVDAKALGQTVQVQAGSQQLTLAQFVEEVWAPKAERRLAPKTWTRDKKVYDLHILHQLGGLPIGQIDAETLVEWQDKFEEDGKGDPLQLKAISILSSIFGEAARRTRSTGVTHNPVALLVKPSAKPRKRAKVFGPLVVEKVRHDLLTNTGHRPGPDQHLLALRDATMISVLYMAGCRPGEMLALKVDSFGSKNLEITAAVSEGLLVDKTKTGKDRRVPINKHLRADVNTMIAAWGFQPGNLLFARSNGDPWTEADWKNWRRRTFNPALQNVQVRNLPGTRPYDLGRHSHSALMLAAGMSLPRLSEIQGHSVRVLSETYTSTIDEYKNDPPIDAEAEIGKARSRVFGSLDPSTGI